MSAESWVSLLNYSVKYNVSLSTLRRRIKNNTIRYKFENGKYLICDQDFPIEKDSSEIREEASPGLEASVLTSANRLVEELKAAYSKILQEKEEQITQLREEVVDLRMLVKVLEEQVKEKNSSPAALPRDSFFFSDKEF